MSESRMFAAIWPLKSKKEEYEIVSTSWIKDYKELKNHGQNLYRYKPLGATKSSLVFILATASSEKDVKSALNSGRIRYPNKSLLEPNLKMTTSEEERDKNLERKNDLKKSGRNSTTESIIKRHLGKKDQTTKSPATPLGNESSSVKKIKLSETVKPPLLASLSKRSSTPKSSENIGPKPLSEDKGPKPSQNKGGPKPSEDKGPKPSQNKGGPKPSEDKGPKPSQNKGPKPSEDKKGPKPSQNKGPQPSDDTVPPEKPKSAIQTTRTERVSLKNTMSQTDNDQVFSRIAALEGKVIAQQEELAITNAKFESSQVEINQTHEQFNKKLSCLEKLLTRQSSEQKKSVSKPTEPPKHSSSNLPSTSAGPTYHLSTTKLIPLGKGVEADQDIWDTLAHVESKEDWALGALMSIFGAESKYYRARAPRGVDQKLKVFPSQPPVIYVVKHFYRKWLREHPDVIDAECAKFKLPDDCVHEDWPTLFENETQKEQEARRKLMMQRLIKKLPALMADKALGLYRQGRRSLSGYQDDDEDDDENGVSDEYDEDTVNLSSGEEFMLGDELLHSPIHIKMEAHSPNSSASDLSPNSARFMRLSSIDYHSDS